MSITVPIDPSKPLVAQVRPYGIEQRGIVSGVRLYRFTRNGEPVYIGVTCNIPERWQQHKNRAPWWGLIDSVELSEPFAYMARALRAEVEAIHRERPIGNRRSVIAQ